MNASTNDKSEEKGSYNKYYCIFQVLLQTSYSKYVVMEKGILKSKGHKQIKLDAHLGVQPLYHARTYRDMSELWSYLSIQWHENYGEWDKLK